MELSLYKQYIFFQIFNVFDGLFILLLFFTQHAYYTSTVNWKPVFMAYVAQNLLIMDITPTPHTLLDPATWGGYNNSAS